MKQLFRGGRVLTPADPTATALLVDDGRISWLGPDADAPPADRVVELEGALVTPAFVDAHVHTTDTGITLRGLSLSGTAGAGALLARVAEHAEGLPGDAVVIGHGWDETAWADQTLPTAGQLDRAGGGRPVYLSRACVHSALVSSALLSGAAGVAGFDPSGWLRRDAHHVAREAAMSSIGPAQRRDAQRAALRRAAALGIAAVHECGGPGTSSEDDFTGLLALPGEGGLPEVYGYWGELGGAAKAKELGALGAAGDLYADGSLGAWTAHLRQSYLDGSEPGTCGHGYVSAEQVAAHLVDCARHGVQGGFHAIGDAAIGTVLEGFAAAEKVIGQDRLRAGRHRIEHAELLDKALIAQLVDFGVVASVQPAFDRLWGGERGMYAQRLGVERALASNPIGSLSGVGVGLAFGSDSPVTDLDPWGTVRAAMRHRNAAQRINARAAFAAHTRGGWRAVRRDEEGVLNPGWPATFVVWDTPAGLHGVLPHLVEPDPEATDSQQPPLPVARRTVVRGSTIYEKDE
jgi:predicted amidohydrolase YtcJ